jgi:hypothetical protein
MSHLGEVIMDSQKLAGVCATIIAVIVLAAAFYFVPPTARVGTGQVTPAQPAEKTDLPAARGPVVREVPNGTVTPNSAPAAPGSRGPVVREVPQ